MADGMDQPMLRRAWTRKDGHRRGIALPGHQRGMRRPAGRLAIQQEEIMDRDALKLTAHIDQMRAVVRTAIERMPPDELVQLFRRCARGVMLLAVDRTMQQSMGELPLVNALAALAIYDICQGLRCDDRRTASRADGRRREAQAERTDAGLRRKPQADF
jgi:hypothetical protein